MKRPSRSDKKTSARRKAMTPPMRGFGGMGGIVMAALALPGVWSEPAHAENAPEAGIVGFKYLYYKEDKRPGIDYARLGHPITVNSPSIYLLAPLSSSWAVEGSAVVDSLSGATPRYHSSGGASKMKDERKAVDMKVRHYGSRSTVSLGFSHSKENDYVSNAVSGDLSLSSEDNNTTWNLGLGYASDKIDATEGGFNGDVFGKKKKTAEFMIGVTQAVSARDLAQFNFAISSGKGYFSDPYKALDVRPSKRTQIAGLVRWNHYLEADGSALRGSYRLYHDNFRINAHTLQGEWVKRASATVTVTPLLRYYSQSSASFYFDPVYANPPPDPTPIGYDPNDPTQLISEDQRLSAFGAVTLGLKLEYRPVPDWTLDAKVEKYQQRSNWRVGGVGSPGLEPFGAISVQLGLSHKF